MPKRTKLPQVPDYVGTSKNPLVQKSNPLQSLAETSLTLPELKIVDVYLSRINSHEPEKRYVRFERGELENLLGVKRLLQDDLDKRLDNLFTSVTLRDETKPKRFVKIGLFEKAHAEQNEDGLWQVDLACTPSAMEYIFNVENIGYLRYRLRNIIDLTSRYSYVMYLYLENNRFRKKWEISVDELRKILNCTAESYDAYKVFNDKVLKKIQKELHEKTECRYTYKPVKKGRKVVKIEFEVETLSTIIEDVEANEITGQMSMEDFTTNRELWETLLDDFRFKREELDELGELLKAVPEIKLPEDNATGTGDISIRRYHYLSLKIKAMERYDKIKPIRNKFSYLRKMVQEDVKNNTKDFAEFKQPDYAYKALEEKLLNQ